MKINWRLVGRMFAVLLVAAVLSGCSGKSFRKMWTPVTPFESSEPDYDLSLTSNR